ncbi:hypothetical protein DVH24_028309 [Malus domestica]|uniref:RNase H type-1 domain-containing protein n=1 Tax=Malus domestica TaxID=3750 RepID=A0A498HE57_MALDO|nr:hypothetical protein DVH24_028309 [Malus domestica]
MEVEGGGRRGEKFSGSAIDYDGAWSKGRGSFAWVVRDFTGIFLGAGGFGNFPCNPSLMAEAEAIRAAIFSCVEKRFSDIQL